MGRKKKNTEIIDDSKSLINPNDEVGVIEAATDTTSDSIVNNSETEDIPTTETTEEENSDSIINTSETTEDIPTTEPETEVVEQPSEAQNADASKAKLGLNTPDFTFNSTIIDETVLDINKVIDFVVKDYKTWKRKADGSYFFKNKDHTIIFDGYSLPIIDGTGLLDYLENGDTQWLKKLLAK